jgi:hypothetical protein
MGTWTTGKRITAGFGAVVIIALAPGILASVQL